MAMNELTGKAFADKIQELQKSGIPAIQAAADIMEHMLGMDEKSRAFLALRVKTAREQDYIKARYGWTEWCIAYSVAHGSSEYDTCLDKLRLELDRDIDPCYMGQLLNPMTRVIHEKKGG